MAARTKRALVTGAGGFVGHHLVTYLKGQGYWVRGVDLKLPEFQASGADEFVLLDLRDPGAANTVTAGVSEVYALAADMGGIGYISQYHAEILRNNSLIDLNTLEAARQTGVERLFYASSACVYPASRQNVAAVVPLREQDAYPADPEEGYGWEKLMIERACDYYREEFGIQTRIARLHNVYGPYSAYQGGREKAPAALARKVASTRDGGSVEIWGDGGQTRSFCYIDDCVEGIVRFTHSAFPGPLNIGTEELVTIDELARLLLDIAGRCNVRLAHRPGPQGVRGRNSDNTLLRSTLGWEPRTNLATGMASLYHWVAGQVERNATAVAGPDQAPVERRR